MNLDNAEDTIPCYIKPALGRGGSTVWHLVRGTTAAVPKGSIWSEIRSKTCRGERMINVAQSHYQTPQQATGRYVCYTKTCHYPLHVLEKKVLTYWHIASMIVLAQENGGAEDDGSHSASTRRQRRQVAVVLLAWGIPHNLLVRTGSMDVSPLWGMCRGTTRWSLWRCGNGRWH